MTVEVVEVVQTGVDVVGVVQDPGVVVVGITESTTGLVGVVETQVQVVEIIASGTVDVVGVAEVVGPRGPAGSDADATALLEAHIVAPEPHPAYDDMPDMTLLFENGLV